MFSLRSLLVDEKLLMKKDLSDVLFRRVTDEVIAAVVSLIRLDRHVSVSV